LKYKESFGEISMFKRKITTIILTIGLFTASSAFAQTLEENWTEFLHYTKIGQFDLAKGYAKAILESEPASVQLLALSEETPEGYELLQRVKESAPDAELAQLTAQILDMIEQGRFIRRTEPKIITEEIRRLSGTERGKLEAIKRLQNSGEYAIPYMLDAMADESRKEELPNIIEALPQIGRDAIRPLVAALQTENVAIKAEIIKALGKIGYPQSLAYLKYIIETSTSGELREMASESIKEIDPAALESSAAELFFQLGEDYYYHAESLAPAEDADFANIWFWDAAKGRLVREEVDKGYFHELMAMRACEWALKADPGFGESIGLWLAGFFKAESVGLDVQENAPDYFGPGHAPAIVYATTAGPEYVHQALARANKDQNAYVALGSIEALATTAGEESLLYRIGEAQPLVQALAFDNKVVRYSAAIAIAAACPKEDFPESKVVAETLAQTLAEAQKQAGEGAEPASDELAYRYAVRAAEVMLKLAQTRNPVIDLSTTQATLIDAAMRGKPEIQILAGQTLARLNSPDAQRAIAAMALNSDNELEVRISAFNSLATSAKLNANMLIEEMVDQIYALISSGETNPDLRSAAAAAFGALNLPSQKVKDLILDQARS
jgi:hypothetical protein